MFCYGIWSGRERGESCHYRAQFGENVFTENAKNEYSKEATVKGYSCNVLDKEELVKTYEQIKAALGSFILLTANQPGAIASVKMLKKEKQEDDYSFWDLKEENMPCNGSELRILPIQTYCGRQNKAHHSLLFPLSFLFPRLWLIPVQKALSRA